MRRLLLVLPILMSALSCSPKKPASEFPELVEEFVYKSLSFSPVTASAQGLHQYQGRDLDRELDQTGFQQIQTQREYYADFHKRLQQFDRNALTQEDLADYDIVETQIGLALFDLDVAQTWRRNPTAVVEMIGSALFNPLVVEYAPKAERFEHIIARLQKIPDTIRIAQRPMSQVPPIWAKVAQQENQGNMNLIDKTLRSAVPGDQKAAYEAAAGPALDALRAFNVFLDKELPQRTRGNGVADWRLGPDHYATKFKLALATDRAPDEILKDADNDLRSVRQRMLDLAHPLHEQMYAGHGDHGDLKGDLRANKIISEVLDRIANRHSTPETYLDDARKDLEEARNFAREKNLLVLPSRCNLRVIETPEFLRGIYAVGGFNPAPALEPQLGAFYWVTPIPADWLKERVESKLREYNFYKLKLLTIHEAMPGHYVQFEFANDVQPKARRLLRSVYGNGPYVEGWAQYITQVVLDQGFLNGSPELRLTFLKEELRVIANAIIDIRLQTNRMTDEQAVELMEKVTFQEHEEAVAKLQRAQLSSAQLPMYFVGWRDWNRVRDLARRVKGESFNLHDFHDNALKQGAVPLPVLARLLTGKNL